MTHTFKLSALAFGIAALTIAAGQSQAQQAAPNCGPRDHVLTQLTERFAERRQAIGIAQNNTIVEVFAADTGTWSIIITAANGKTCLIASGRAFETLNPTPINTDPKA